MFVASLLLCWLRLMRDGCEVLNYCMDFFFSSEYWWLFQMNSVSRRDGISQALFKNEG